MAGRKANPPSSQQWYALVGRWGYIQKHISTYTPSLNTHREDTRPSIRGVLCGNVRVCVADVAKRNERNQGVERNGCSWAKLARVETELIAITIEQRERHVNRGRAWVLSMCVQRERDRIRL